MWGQWTILALEPQNQQLPAWPVDTLMALGNTAWHGNPGP